MIPLFPEFKKIEFADKHEVEQYTAQFPPYSDYSFISLWSWDTTGGIFISLLHDNLVVKFTDYLTGKQFYSFLGANKVNDTAQKLLDLCTKEQITPLLKLLPEISTANIDETKFKVEEDRDNFDYIYSVATFLEMDDPKFHVRRKHCRYFEKTYPHSIMKLDLSQTKVKDSVVALFDDWANMKIENGATDSYFHNEYLALLRYLNIAPYIDCIALGIFSDDKLIAAAISENKSNGYNTSHFQKAVNRSFKGLNVFLIHEGAKLLHNKGIQYINWEQDLGIPGLRENKESYLPCRFLKKYTLSTL